MPHLKEKMQMSHKAKERLLRGIFMLLFLLIMSAARLVIYFVITIQFIILFFDKPNKQLLKLGKSLSIYSYQIMLFLTYNSDIRPYPFTPWPSDHEEK